MHDLFSRSDAVQDGVVKLHAAQHVVLHGKKELLVESIYTIRNFMANRLYSENMYVSSLMLVLFLGRCAQVLCRQGFSRRRDGR